MPDMRPLSPDETEGWWAFGIDRMAAGIDDEDGPSRLMVADRRCVGQA